MAIRETVSSLSQKEQKNVAVGRMGFSLPQDRLKMASALADPLNASILVVLAISEAITLSRCLSFSGLMKASGLTGDTGRSTLSYHLGILTGAKLVVKSTEEIPEDPGSYRVYKITELGKSALKEILGYNSDVISRLAEKYKKA